MIFGTLNPKNIWLEYLTVLSTSLVNCSHCTLGNRKKVIFNSIIHIYFWLFMVSQNKHLTAPPESVTTLGCELQNFLIWLKVCCVLSNIGGSEKSQLWAVVGDSEKNWLWWVATRMSQQVFRVTTFCAVLDLSVWRPWAGSLLFTGPYQPPNAII